METMKTNELNKNKKMIKAVRYKCIKKNENVNTREEICYKFT
jgi:hypothetical protein